MTPKQEAFARAYVETGNASEAYRQCYSAEKMSAQVVNNEASKLLQHHGVTVRVQELQAAAQKRTAITVDYITDMLVRAAKKAEAEAKGASALVSAAMGLGKLHGHITEKREIKHVSGVEDLNDDELANLARSGSRGAAQAAPGSPRSH
jgi:tRNA A-37 threonylcarbamoyl transferase component Bud32